MCKTFAVFRTGNQVGNKTTWSGLSGQNIDGLLDEGAKHPPGYSSTLKALITCQIIYQRDCE